MYHYMLLFLALTVWPMYCQAGFMFTFNGSAEIATSLSQCVNYPISVVSRDDSNDTGVPPYYLIAFRPSKIPTKSYIGFERNNLSWTVNQPSNSRLLLTVIDSQNVFSGVSTNFYDITDGDSSCLPATPSVDISVGANVSSPISTCEKVGFRVYGTGKKPYTILLAAVNSPVVTNVTLGMTDDDLTYPNRADPDNGLMASVYDANGVWGSSTDYFKTTGPPVTSTSCPGLTSKPGDSANTDQHPAKPLSKIVITIIIVLIVATLLIAIYAFVFWRRRVGRRGKPGPALLPDAWQGPSPYSPYDPPPNSKLARYQDDTVSLERSGSSSHIGMSRTLSSSKLSQPSGSRLAPGASPEWDSEHELIIQHRDGGPLQEIPPSYVDAAAGSSANHEAAYSSRSESSSAPS